MAINLLSLAVKKKIKRRIGGYSRKHFKKIIGNPINKC